MPCSGPSKEAIIEWEHKEMTGMLCALVSEIVRTGNEQIIDDAMYKGGCADIRRWFSSHESADKYRMSRLISTMSDDEKAAARDLLNE